jgi:hypothetical protein
MNETGGMNQTADLLDALRRRRGEREAAVYEDDPFDTDLTSTGIRIVETPIDEVEDAPEAPVTQKTAPPSSARNTGAQPSARNTGSQPRARKGRTAMPSWDEIVFGARPDDDLA